MKTFQAQSKLSVSELYNKLNQVIAEDFDDTKSSRKYQYYGKINGKNFDICNIKYGPYSTAPYVEGVLEDKAEGGTLITFKIDIDEQKNYVNTIITLAIFVVGIGATLFTIMGQGDKLMIITLAAVMIIFPLLYAAFVKMLLKSTQKDELKKILSITESKLTDN